MQECLSLHDLTSQVAPAATPQTADTPFAKAAGSGSGTSLQAAASVASGDEYRTEADGPDDLDTDATSTVAPSTLRSESGDVDGGECLAQPAHGNV